MLVDRERPNRGGEPLVSVEVERKDQRCPVLLQCSGNDPGDQASFSNSGTGRSLPMAAMGLTAWLRGWYRLKE